MSSSSLQKLTILFLTLAILNVTQGQYFNQPSHRNDYRGDNTQPWDKDQRPAPPQSNTQSRQPPPQSNTQNVQSSKSPLTGLYDFSLNMLKKHTARHLEGNFVISPLSMATVLSLLQQATTEDSQIQLKNTLGMNKEESKNLFPVLVETTRTKRSSPNKISLANAIFVDSSKRLTDRFHNVATNSYKANVENVNFKRPEQSANRINQWVSQQTEGNIPSLLSPDAIEPNTNCVMLNAVYFKGVWNETFNERRTSMREFFPHPGHQISCSFMHQNGYFMVGDDKEIGAKWVELPFVNGEYSMMFLIPKEQHDLNNLINKMSSNDFQKLLTPTEPKKTILGVPKFNIAHESSMVDVLKDMGISKIFTSNSGITDLVQDSIPVQVANALQKATISIDEHGSRAAAVTALLVNTLSLESYLEEFHFTANQPFLAIILSKSGRVPVFIARIEDPSKPF